MKFLPFDKDDGKTKVYAFEVARAEIEACTFTEADQALFESCGRGPISKKLLGISILAKRIEDMQEAAGKDPKRWFEGIIEKAKEDDSD